MSEYIQKTPESCSIGDTIEITLYSKYDKNTYTGKIHAIADYDRARPYGDIAAAHNDMVQGAAILGIELMDCRLDKYFILYCHDNVIRAIGFQWIDGGVVKLVSESGTFDIRLYNVSPEKSAKALAILRHAGFVCQLLPKQR